MDNDDLQRLWVAGASRAELSRASGQNPVAVTSRIRRLRAKEGEIRWPRREGGKPKLPKPPKAKRLGRRQMTLPLLDSLK